DTKEAFRTTIFALEDLGDASEVTGREFIKAQREMLGEADAWSDAMRQRSRKSDEWIPARYLKFLSDQGPSAIVGFADTNDKQQHRLVDQWQGEAPGRGEEDR